MMVATGINWLDHLYRLDCDRKPLSFFVLYTKITVIYILYSNHIGKDADSLV